MLENLNIATKINSIKRMKNIIIKKINYTQSSSVDKKLNYLGERILNKNLFEIKKFI